VHQRLQRRVQPIGARDIVEAHVAGQVGVARVCARLGAVAVDRARVGKGRVQAELAEGGGGRGGLDGRVGSERKRMRRGGCAVRVRNVWERESESEAMLRTEKKNLAVGKVS
jgi:hypothetical protein